MLKNLSRLESQIEDKMYHLFCDHDSPVEHVKAALLQMMGFCDQIIEQAKNPVVVEPAIEPPVEDKE